MPPSHASPKPPASPRASYRTTSPTRRTSWSRPRSRPSPTCAPRSGPRSTSPPTSRTSSGRRCTTPRSSAGPIPVSCAVDQIAHNLRQADGTPRLDLRAYEDTYQAQERLFQRGRQEGSLRDFDTRHGRHLPRRRRHDDRLPRRSPRDRRARLRRRARRARAERHPTLAHRASSTSTSPGSTERNPARCWHDEQKTVTAEAALIDAQGCDASAADGTHVLNLGEWDQLAGLSEALDDSDGPRRQRPRSRR